MVVNGEEKENLEFRLLSGGRTIKSDLVVSSDPGFTKKGIISIPFYNEDKKQSIQAFPVPFKETLTIQVTFNNAGEKRIGIYNVEGSTVRILSMNCMSPGIYHLVWNGKNEGGLKCNPGVYFIRIIQQEKVECERVILAQ